MTDTPKPLDPKHKDFLDDLRHSGKTNMFGGAIYPNMFGGAIHLRAEFGLSSKEAREALLLWMEQLDNTSESDQGGS